MRLWLVSFILIFSLPLYATHNRGGEITYRHVSGLTYEITVTTCTSNEQGSLSADRELLGIDWGDGNQDSIARTAITDIFDFQSRKNAYVALHTYSGPGSYTISVSDPNRTNDIVNITNSVDKIFCIQTTLIISPFLGTPNSSPIFDQCPCPELACASQPYYYNSLAYDPDGDSLGYELVSCNGDNCLPLNSNIYSMPNVLGGGTFSIDPISGTVTWDEPNVVGRFNFAILVKEYRNGVQIGTVLRDIQIIVSPCNNINPEINDLTNACVDVGDNITTTITASDNDAQYPQNFISLSASSALFQSSNPPTFNPVSGNGSVSSTFQWFPTCNDIQINPHQVLFHVEDADPLIPLSNFQDLYISVNAPKVTGLSLNPIANSIELNWDIYSCPNAIGYNIYRKSDSTVVSSSCCYPGVAMANGYELLTQINDINTINFTDVDHINVGNKYCYVVTALFDNGVESCPSDVHCTSVDFEVPILTHVTVDQTNNSSGSDTIIWSYPKELDTIFFSGPYYYELYSSNGLNGANQLIYTSPSRTSIVNSDTIYFHQNINTESTPNNYFVALFNNGQEVGRSNTASSIYLSITPNDNQLELSWEYDVTWVNDTFYVYRETFVGSGIFNVIDTTTEQFYVDTGLVNGATYCYKIRSKGGYDRPDIVNPIFNWSQESCETPLDFTAPCAPNLTVDFDCELIENSLSWNNPNNTCADDVTMYNVYYKPTLDGTYELIGTLNSATDTFFSHQNDGSIAGCYFVTAIDSVQYGNESDSSNIVCIENCEGQYELPNVFSPNGDDINDLYHPLLPYRFVKDIDLKIFNRWGNLVFTTTDRDINWDGNDENSGKLVSPGVYFYECIINEVTLEGITPRTVQGIIHVIY